MYVEEDEEEENHSRWQDRHRALIKSKKSYSH